MLETVGTRIEALAKSKGLPQNQALAKLVGVSYEALRKWRAGLTVPSRRTQQVIAAKLGVNPEEFMHGVTDGDISKLPDQESRLLRGFRKLLDSDRIRFLSEVEMRVAELDELSKRIQAERSRY